MTLPMQANDDGTALIEGQDGALRVIRPTQVRRCAFCGMWESHHVCHAPGAMTMDDALTVLLTYVSRQYFPPPIQEALRVLRSAERWDLAETGLGSALQPTPKGRFVKVGQ